MPPIPVETRKVSEVFPRIVRSQSETVITIRPLFGQARPQGEIKARLIPMEGWKGQMTWGDSPLLPVRTNGEVLEVTCRFEREQEYLLELEDSHSRRFVYRLYALDADLFARKPWKGDFHMHTNRSDGVETPAYAPGACRRSGLDFMAVTDHGQYQPSLEAMEAFEGVEIDLRIYPGEEVHPPEVPVHIVNFGGSFSVNALFTSPSYRAEVEALAQTLHDLPEDIDPQTYAACVWCFARIAEGGGLGIFCHPYWFSGRHLDVPMALSDLIFARQPFGAYELIGGYHRRELESNTLQVARYHEERNLGRQIPIVGVSDSHGFETGELFGWYYTIAFAEDCQLSELVGAIRGLYSVAVEAVAGETARAYGPFRLVRYAQYLMREIFPLHDALCAEEGRLMLAHAAGDPVAAAQLRLLNGRVAALYRRLWDR